MKRLMIAAVVMAIGSAAAYAAEMETLRAGSELGAISREAITRNGFETVPAARYPSADAYFTEDCKRLVFKAGSPLISERARLYSEECVEVCGDGHGSHYPCRTICRDNWRRTARIEIMPRTLLAWEEESFRVCLKGPETRIYLDRPAYEYEVSRTGDYDIAYHLKPVRKIATRPDEDGLKLAEFAYEPGSGGFKMAIGDSWAKEYAGEKVVIKAELRKDAPYWFDQGLGEREFILETAREYRLDILPRGAALENGGKYFVKWGFKRISTISRDTFIEKGDTYRVEAAK